MQKGITDKLPGKRWKSTIGITQRQAVKEWEDFVLSVECERREALQRQKYLILMGGIEDEIKLESINEALGEVPPPTDSELEPLVKQWLQFKASSVSAGQVVVLTSHTKFLLSQIETTELTIDQWEGLVAELQNRKRLKKWSGKYCHDVLVSIKNFYLWASKRITVPPWVFDKEYNITIPKKAIEFFSPLEIKALMESASEELKAIILIALNTSCTQEDISQLTWDMIDFHAGTLTRARTKHKHRGDGDAVLTVTYHLWTPILDYLKTVRRKNGLVFSRPDGSPLVMASRNDQIARQFGAITKKLEIAKTFKHLRKTGATALGKSTTYRVWREVYLCNSPKSVSDLHYDATSELPKEASECIFQSIFDQK